MLLSGLTQWFRRMGGLGIGDSFRAVRELGCGVGLISGLRRGKRLRRRSSGRVGAWIKDSVPPCALSSFVMGH